MAKKKNYTANDWIKAYKDYVLQYGEIAQSIKDLLDYKELPFSSFGELYDDLESLEQSILLNYFQASVKVLHKDKSFQELDKKEQHLTFLYVLMEMVSKDELFLKVFQKQKAKQASFMIHLQKTLNHQELSWAEIEGWKPDFLDDLNLNPKRSLLINHALSCILFYLDDKSMDKQDTDAYIEKSTDLLFKLTDTSTLHSLFDLGKFIYSRGKNKMFN